MHFNVLLTLSTLTALSGNAAAHLPLGDHGGNALGGLGAFGPAPGSSSTPIPTLMKKPSTPIATPSPTQTPTLSTPVPTTPVPKSSASPRLKDNLPFGGSLGSSLGSALESLLGGIL